jgi:hypothetical protein
MTDRPTSFVDLVVEAGMAEALAAPFDDAILSGSDIPTGDAPASGGTLLAFKHNSFAFQISREDAIGHGLVKPTPQERAVMAANSDFWRRERQARIVRGAAWFSAILDVAGPVGSAMLEIHTPDEYGDCVGCGFEDLAGLAWPCATVLAGAQAAGIPEPAGI